MNALVIEDERHAADRLIKMIRSVDPSIRILGVLESVSGSIEWFLRHEEPDLVFMDIQLDDGICFEIFEAVKLKAPVIFTTAFNEYAIRAFKVNSIDYLLKPVDGETLRSALEKYESIYREKDENRSKIERLFSQLITNYKTRFFIKVGEHCKSVPVNEIKYFCIIERATFMKTVSGNHYALDYSLDQLQKMLDPLSFFRINRTIIVNLDFLRDIISYSASRLKLIMKDEKENSDFIVSREKVSDFKKWLDR